MKKFENRKKERNWKEIAIEIKEWNNKQIGDNKSNIAELEEARIFPIY